MPGMISPPMDPVAEAAEKAKQEAQAERLANVGPLRFCTAP